MRVSVINLNLVAQDAIGRTMLDQARFFRRRGDEVQLYVTSPPRGVPGEIEQLTHVVTMSDLITRSDRFFARSDLYVYHYPGFYPLIDSMKEIGRGAVIFYHHNVTPPELWNDSPEREKLRRSLEDLASYAHYADLIVTPSLFNAEQLVNEHGCEHDRIRVLPQAVALDRFAPGPKDPALLRQYGLEGRRVMLFVGRMASNKRVDLLVEALPLVRQQVPNAVLMLVGDDRGNPDFQKVVAGVRALAAERGEAHAVIFTGIVDDLPAYYRLADVYATASLHEGFGVPLIEAMASGLPVVASRATAHPWVVGEAGLLAEPGDVADMADKIIQVLTDDDMCGELVQRGLTRAREFSLEHYELGWAKIVAEATAWLPDLPFSPAYSLVTRSANRGFRAGAKDANPEMHETLLNDELHQLEERSDVMMRDYVVHSCLPVVGPLIAWIRRNLTSHLREPYVDPTFERQVMFNWQVVGWLKRSFAYWTGQLTQERAESQTRIEALEAEVKQLRERVAQLVEKVESLDHV